MEAVCRGIEQEKLWGCPDGSSEAGRRGKRKEVREGFHCAGVAFARVSDPHTPTHLSTIA